MQYTNDVCALVAQIIGITGSAHCFIMSIYTCYLLSYIHLLTPPFEIGACKNPMRDFYLLLFRRALRSAFDTLFYCHLAAGLFQAAGVVSATTLTRYCRIPARLSCLNKSLSRSHVHSEHVIFNFFCTVLKQQFHRTAFCHWQFLKNIHGYILL